MKKKLTTAECLIVAADFKPPSLIVGGNYVATKQWTRQQVINLCQELQGTGVYIKVNSALRVCGYELIAIIHSYGLKVFADLKLVDISETVGTDGTFLSSYKPELVTIMANAGAGAIKALKTALPDSEILAVTILTSIKEEECQAIYDCSVEEAVVKLAELAQKAGADGFICSPAEVAILKELFGDSATYNTPAIRPLWSIVNKDDQNPDRTKTPEGAILAGSDRIVIGRPIIQAANRREAVEKTLAEIESAKKKLQK